jgi:hypothetical protein
MKKYFILQPSRLIASTRKNDPEVGLEIRLREVIDLGLDVSDDQSKRIKIVTRNNIYIIHRYEEEDIDIWHQELRSAWKGAVSAVIENPISPTADKAMVTLRDASISLNSCM